VEVFEPEGEVELSGGEVAGGNEAKDGVLDLVRESGEGVAGAGAGDGVELIEAELIVEGERGRRGEGDGLAGARCEGGVDAGGEAFRLGPKDESGDGLQGGELGVAQILCDVDGAAVDKLLDAKAGGGFRGAVRRDDVQMFRADGHDTTLLMMLHGLRSCTHWTLERGGKVYFGKARFSPKGGMSIWAILWGVWITRHLSEFR
jgi:hypothetical protein